MYLPAWIIAVSALLNVTSIYHDTLLAKVAKSDPRYKPLIPISPHTRYTRAWCEKDSRYKWAARMLEALRFVELLIEMGLRRTVSTKTRWRGIVLIEAIKCVRLYSSYRLALTVIVLGLCYDCCCCALLDDRSLPHLSRSGTSIPLRCLPGQTHLPLHSHRLLLHHLYRRLRST